MSDLPLTRRRIPAAADQRAAIHLIRPFLDRFEGWNRRSAWANAAILSHLTSPNEKAEHQAKLAALTAEVEAAYAEFELTVAGHPHHSRIGDIDAAFVRLLETLRRGRSE